ncbi:helix-turn-helix domain-containing protein [Microbacterium terrisoli]|uniref:helix-turn-helix domain-containing protein n=1 Tax=Microbacterium terrisoli TaxID=3242192 RepID=UPI0028047CB6|nr:helix-turn-helix domain-containing protein [Microbacterium protaetiae]
MADERGRRRGPAVHRRKIKDRQQLVDRYLAGGITQRELAEIYDVTEHTVWSILRAARRAA